MYFDSIREIRDTFPKAIKLLAKEGRVLFFEPLSDVFMVEHNGLVTKKTINEMEALEKSLQNKPSILTEVKRIFSNKIKPWD